MQRNDIYKAVANYHRTDDLKPNTPQNGSEIYVEVLWKCEEDESFPGEWVFHVLNDNLEWSEKFPYWIPEWDLIIKEKVK